MLVGFEDWVVGVSNWIGPDSLAPLTASREARLGHRISEFIAAGRVWGLGGGCLNFDAACRMLELVAGCWSLESVRDHI